MEEPYTGLFLKYKTVHPLNILKLYVDTTCHNYQISNLIHSLARLLTLYDGIQLRYVPCSNKLGMPKNVREYVASKGVPQVDYENLEEAIMETDILYVTRIQRERFSSHEEYLAACENYVINEKR